MKTGLLTFHAAHHYGAQLQAYALMRAICDTGADGEIIHYVRQDTERAKHLFRKMHTIVDVVANLHTLIHLTPLRRRAERFERFVKEQMRLSPQSYGTYAQLAGNPPAYDAYVCGSDQIWNPLIFREQDFDPAFFAAFAKSGKKIAYAPSFGLPDMPMAHHAALRTLVSDFAALSVRERNGEVILSEVCGRKAVTVLDPTLLLPAKSWKEAAAPVHETQPYLLCYFISDPAPFAPVVQAISKKMGLRIVSLCGARRTVRGTKRIILDAGPREFLGWFAQAAFVLTDSFHGTIFSVNFEKPFYTFAYTGSGKAKVSSRLDSILEILGLRERMLTQPENGLADEPSYPEIDYDKVGSVLERERNQSLSWLSNALQGASDTEEA